MTRYEFTQRLRDSLMGEVPASVVEEHVRFYDRYINDEIANGKSEKEVLDGLGDARLIAKTILETWQSEDTDLEYHGGDFGEDQSSYTSYGTQTDSYGSQNIYRTTRIYEEDGSSSSRQNGDSFFGMNGKIYRLDKWYQKLIPIAILLLILGFIFMMFFGMMKLSIMVLTSPVFWGFILIVTVLRILSRRR